MKKISYSPLLPLLLTVILLSGCNKFLDIVPVGQVIPTRTSEYRGLMTSAYESFPKHRSMLSMRGVQIFPYKDSFGLSGFAAYKEVFAWNDSENAQGYTEEFPYQMFYRVTFYCNEVIANGLDAEQDSPEAREQIVAEAYTLRAFSFFELLNMYAPKYTPETDSKLAVPLYTEIDTEQTFPPASVGTIYEQIFSDLDHAESLMKVRQYTDSTKVYRFSLEGLLALRSRVHLYRSEWAKSLDYARKALQISTVLEDLNDPKAIMPMRYHSKENICALEEVVNQTTREYAGVYDEYLKKFRPGDLRHDKYFAEEYLWYIDGKGWVSKKYPDQGSRCTIRRSEVFLNGAEAAARLGNDAEARRLLTPLIRSRYTPEAGTRAITELNTLSGQSLTDYILLERSLEYGAEGFDFYDLKRTTQPGFTKMVDGQTVTVKQGDPRYTIPLPLSARQSNPLLR